MKTKNYKVLDIEELGRNRFGERAWWMSLECDDGAIIEAISSPWIDSGWRLGHWMIGETFEMKIRTGERTNVVEYLR